MPRRGSDSDGWSLGELYRFQSVQGWCLRRDKGEIRDRPSIARPSRIIMTASYLLPILLCSIDIEINQLSRL